MLRLRHPVALLLIAALALLAAMRSMSTPVPVGADAPDVVFSADRADAILRDLLQEKRPHVAGSPLNAVVSDRILRHFRDAGYQPELQTRFHCNPLYGACSPVQNIIAVRQGSIGKHSILLTAHYDSTWAGPGAADGGAGVAVVLEIARMLADFPPFENDVVFLITDSEENGLIGADAFAGHHALFPAVRMVINLEARGVTGPSAMFETGEGNRSVIRILSKNVPRPVANSLVYELYKRMPNDTDYTVYKRRGVMGVNFAFAQGVALYHSTLDDPDHLDAGSLQHHGDNAWGMLTALGDRKLTDLYHSEDAGYIDLFGTRLSHYPVSIAGGLALFLGVWSMIAIGLAFRKEFRYRQLRWGLLALPALCAAIVLGGYLLSWPLGRWPDLHPLEHPYPWVGRLTLLLMVVLAVYGALKVFSGRVSACAWMILTWASLSVLALWLASELPAAAHLALLPLAMFALGSLVDLFRKKSPAPLLTASVLGYATAAYLSFYHFLMLDVVVNFDASYIKVVHLWLAVLTAMPMLLAFVRLRELTWQPARWLAVAILIGCFFHLFLPGYTAERPRGMTLKYSEVEGAAQGHIVLESVYRDHDQAYAGSHDFEIEEINDGRLGMVAQPVRAVAPLGLPGVGFEVGQAVEVEQGWRRSLQIETGTGPYLGLTFAPEAGLSGVWVDGMLALDTAIETKQERGSLGVRLINPGARRVQVDVLTSSPAAFRVAIVTWHDLPGVLTAPFMGNWPDDARPAFVGPRAEKIQEFTVSAAE
jgi:hypothetical protein